MPSRGDTEGPAGVKALLSFLRFTKKKKKREEGASVCTQPTSEVREERVQPATVTGAPCAAPAKQEPAEGPSEVPVQPADGGAADHGMPHERLLAALESAQNTEPLNNSLRLSHTPPDLTGVLFAQRTKTRSGNGMLLPARLAEGTASGINSGEAGPVIHSVADGLNSYVPYGTTTVGPIHSAANVTHHGDSINLNNLQDMLYADYEALERMQVRPENRGPGAGLPSALARREQRAPDVPTQPGARTTPQLPQLQLPLPPAKPPAHAAAGADRPPAAGAPAADAPAQDFVSAPLMHLQQTSGVSSPSQPHAVPPAARAADVAVQPARRPGEPAPHSPAAAAEGYGPSASNRGAQQEPRQPLAEQASPSQTPPWPPGAADEAAARRNGAARAPAEQQLPQPPSPPQQQQQHLAAADSPTQPPPQQPHGGHHGEPRLNALLHPGGNNSEPAIAAGGGAGAVGAAAASPAVPLTASNAAEPGGPDSRADASRAAGAPDRAASPSTQGAGVGAGVGGGGAGVHGEQPVPLSRPLKLTTACLGAHTTLCDSATDQSFQRALQRKMQMVYKWLQASDLTAPPDPRLEVPVPPEASQSSPQRGERTSQPRPGGEGSLGRQGSGERPEGDGRAGGRLAAAPPGGAAGLPGGGVAVRGGQGPAQGYSLRPPRGPPLLTSEEIAALEALASVKAGVSRGPQQAQPARPQPSQPQGANSQPQAPQAQQQGQPAADGHGSAAAAPPPADANGAAAAAAAPAAVSPDAGADGDADSPPVGEHSAASDAHLRPAHPQAAFRALQGGEPQGAAGSHKGAAQPGSSLLQHSLSELYAGGQAALGAHLPPRVLSGSDDAFTATATATDRGGPAAAASTSASHGAVALVGPAVGNAGAEAGAGAAGVVAAAAASDVGEVSPPQAGAVLGAPGAGRHAPSAAVPARTKTIAVASHCPPELQPQPPAALWTIDDFTLLKKLYEGSLSVVCQAQHKRSRRHVALKIYKRSRLHEMERFQLAREICLHIRIVHPHVVALYAAWKDSKYVYLALEWAPQGNSFDFLVSRGGRLGEEEAARVVIKPLFSALAFLHSQHFIHRDVKLENLLLDASCTLKLADFGLAIDQKFEQANTRLGTFGYFAPEVLDCPLKKGPFDLKDASVPGYDSRVDVWSAGVVGYEVLTGRAPFSASSPAKIIQAIRTRVLEFPGISEEGKDFLRSALTRDPAARPTARQLLAHPWILRHCRGGGPVVNAGGVVSPALAAPLPIGQVDEDRPAAAQAAAGPMPRTSATAVKADKDRRDAE